MPGFDSVLITGASSGLGRALALACARPGAVLHLCGRDAARLAAVAGECTARGADARPRVLDVREAAAVADWVGGAGRLDLVVANAGISAGTGDGRPERPEQIRAIFAVNLDGMLNTALPALRVMAAQPTDAAGVRGRIATVASIAAFLPWPGTPSYCASKAAVDAWTVATAATARRQGILLTSLCPGFVRTPMTAANPFPMPGLMEADRAAAIMLRAVAAGRRRVAFPWWSAAGARLVALLPPGLSGAWLGVRAGKAPLGGEG
jgi:NAD(P)-dependent dehydrogenase (short-subunit alcohol dehydrogenase family)